MTTNPQLCRWAFTINDNEELKLNVDHSSHVSELSKLLEEITKPKWCFQLEKGSETGRLHFQGRISFKKAKRKSEILKLVNDTKFKHIHLSAEHDEARSSFYCLKKDNTYVDGPWSNENTPLYIPRQVREIENLHPWQEKIIELAKVWDTRSIHIIYDTSGNIGKSTLCTYMGVHRLAKLLPFCNDYKDILRMTFDVGNYSAYLIDMPRAINKERLFQFFAAIETIKSGYCYDDRYKFQDRYFDCPQIFVFTNVMPDFEMLSLDRWCVWTIEDLKLVPYEPTT